MRKLALLAAVVSLIFWSWAHAQESPWGKSADACGYAGPSPASAARAANRAAGMNASGQGVYSATAHTCDVDEVFFTVAFAVEVAGKPAIWIQPTVHDCLLVPVVNSVYCSMVEAGAGRRTDLTGAFPGPMGPLNKAISVEPGWVCGSVSAVRLTVGGRDATPDWDFSDRTLLSQRTGTGGRVAFCAP
jgi:hypothetical protein